MQVVRSSAALRGEDERDLDARPARLRAWVLARLSVALSFHGVETRRRALSEQAVAMAREVADQFAPGYALAGHCDAFAGPESCDVRLAESAEIVRLARETGDRQLGLLGRRLRFVALLEVGDGGGTDVEPGSARALLQQWLAAGLDQRTRDSEWLPETAQLAQATVDVGARELAVARRSPAELRGAPGPSPIVDPCSVRERPTVGHPLGSREPYALIPVRAMAGRTRKADSLEVERRFGSSRPRHVAVLTKSQGQAGAIVVTVPSEPRYLSAPSST